MEDNDDGQFLLIYDPAKPLTRFRSLALSFRPGHQLTQKVQQLEAKTKENQLLFWEDVLDNQKQLRNTIRVPSSQLHHRQYQVVSIEGVFANEAQKNAAKIVRSRRIP